MPHSVCDVLNTEWITRSANAKKSEERPPGWRAKPFSSVGGRAGYEGFSLYCASKAALEGMTRVWAAELGPQGHTVNAVAPGPVQSDMLDKIPAELKDFQKVHTPMEHRFGTADDIAQIVAWLAEESSRWITGQTLSSTGGFAMY